MAGEIFIIIGCIIALGIIIAWYYQKVKKPAIDLSPLCPNVLNLNPNLANGHKSGFELYTKPGENGEHVVTFLPNDYLPDSRGNTVDEIKPHTFVLGRNQRISLGVGHLGAQKETVIYLPSTFRKLDRRIAESEFGHMLINGMYYTELENQTYAYLKKIENKMNKLLINHPDKSVALANAEIKDTIQDALSSLSLKKDDEKKSAFGDRLRDRGMGGY